MTVVTDGEHQLLPVGLGLYENAYTDGLPFRNPMLTKAIAYIRANLFTIRSISEISDSLFITESYLFEIFKTTLHISPKKYITAKRLLTAKREPDLGDGQTQIYQKMGFSSHAAFYRSYTAFFGHAPSKESLRTFPAKNIKASADKKCPQTLFDMYYRSSRRMVPPPRTVSPS